MSQNDVFEYMFGRDNVKLFRFRKPSVKTVLGVTKAKKKIKKQSGITAATKPLRA